jgi:hypothetical protein
MSRCLYLVFVLGEVLGDSPSVIETTTESASAETETVFVTTGFPSVADGSIRVPGGGGYPTLKRSEPLLKDDLYTNDPPSVEPRTSEGLANKDPYKIYIENTVVLEEDNVEYIASPTQGVAWTVLANMFDWVTKSSEERSGRDSPKATSYLNDEDK